MRKNPHSRILKEEHKKQYLNTVPKFCSLRKYSLIHPTQKHKEMCEKSGEQFGGAVEAIKLNEVMLGPQLCSQFLS